MKPLNTPAAAPDRMARRSRWNACVLMALALAVATAGHMALTPLCFSASIGGWRVGLWATLPSAFPACYSHAELLATSLQSLRSAKTCTEISLIHSAIKKKRTLR